MISALHVVNGIVIVGVAGFLTRLAAMHAMQAAKETAAAPVSTPARP